MFSLKILAVINLLIRVFYRTASHDRQTNDFFSLFFFSTRRFSEHILGPGRDSWPRFWGEPHPCCRADHCVPSLHNVSCFVYSRVHHGLEIREFSRS